MIQHVQTPTPHTCTHTHCTASSTLFSSCWYTFDLYPVLLPIECLFHHPTLFHFPFEKEHIDSSMASPIATPIKLQAWGQGDGWWRCGGGGCVRRLGVINCKHRAVCRKANWEEGKGSPHPKPHPANNKRMPKWRCISTAHHKPFLFSGGEKNWTGNDPICKAKRNNQKNSLMWYKKTNTNNRIHIFKRKRCKLIVWEQKAS